MPRPSATQDIRIQCEGLLPHERTELQEYLTKRGLNVHAVSKARFPEEGQAALVGPVVDFFIGYAASHLLDKTVHELAKWIKKKRKERAFIVLDLNKPLRKRKTKVSS